MRGHRLKQPTQQAVRSGWIGRSLVLRIRISRRQKNIFLYRNHVVGRG
jgi:hypothetical protein